MPAKAGAAAEVPPTPWKSAKGEFRSQELVLLPVPVFPSCWQMIRKLALEPLPENSEISGTWRKLAEGMPLMPDWNEGLAFSVLGPPLPATRSMPKLAAVGSALG